MKYRRSLDPAASLCPALAVLLVVVVLLFALLLTGCTEGNSPVEDCGNCAPVGTQPPPASLVYEATQQGRADALATCPGVADVTDYPTDIEWLLCDFKVGSCCAWGSTSQRNGHIRISMSNHDNVLPLVRWESRNWYWLFGGCSNQMVARYRLGEMK
jgi:hypothetical protein